MNNNFEIVLKTNKEFISLMNELFDQLCNSSKYIDYHYYAQSHANSEKLIKEYYEKKLKEHSIDFKRILVHDPNSRWSKEEKNILVELDDLNSITWQFEIEKKVMNFKKVFLTLLESDKMDAGLVIEEDSSKLNLYLSGVYKEFELITQEVNQELIDLILVTEDLEVPELKKINVKDIIINISNMKKVVKQFNNKENKKGF